MNAASSSKESEGRKNFVDDWTQRAHETGKVFAGTPRILRLIWTASPGYTSAVVFLNLVLGLMPLADLWILKLLIDAMTVFLRTGSTAAAVSTMIRLIGLLAIIRLVNNSLEPTQRFAQQQLGEYLMRDMNTLLLEKANSLGDISVFENPSFYDMLQRARNESGYRPLTILTTLTSIMRSSIGLLSMVLVLVAFQPWLAVLVTALSLPHLLVQFKHQREGWAIQNDEIPEVRRMSYFSHVITERDYAQEIRVFGLEKFFLNQYMKKFEEFRTIHSKMRFRHWRNNVMLASLSAVGTACAYAYVAFRAIESSITIGSLTLYLSAISQIEYGMDSIIWAVASLYEGNLYANNVFEFLAIPSAMAEAPADSALMVPEKFARGIKFDHVAFSYPGKEKPVLTDVSCALLPGQTVALVGENGAGKTTIVKLLSRLYDPTAGQILIDDVDLRKYDLQNWRSRIGVIFQNFCRFHMSARENIGIGQVDAIDHIASVKAAAARGNAAAVVQKLNEGYETMLGHWFSGKDRGAELSGGEWQKIGLARAFMRSTVDSKNGNGSGEPSNGNGNTAKEWDGSLDLSDKLSWVLSRDAQLLILDEPTAALDAQAEYDVYLRFHELTRGKTTLLISHRLSTVRMADLILVLESGAIIEQGSHAQLMEKAGEYARLYNLQADRYK